MFFDFCVFLLAGLKNLEDFMMVNGEDSEFRFNADAVARNYSP